VTINIAVVSSEALVLGCDSVASVTTPMMNPFNEGFAKDKDGNVIKDDQGRWLVPMVGIEHVVTDVMAGVTKMFKIYDARHTVVAATTAGMGKLNDRPIAGIAYDFAQSVKRGKKMTKVSAVAQAFYDYVRAEYERDQKATEVPEEYWSGLEFLLGGIGKDDKFPVVYRIRMKDKLLRCECENGEAGMLWAGQADCVEKIIRGYDAQLRNKVDAYAAELMNSHHKKMSETFVRMLEDVLKAVGQEMPKGVNTDLPPLPAFEMDWKQFKVGVSYSNLPLQEAIDFVSFLVLTQAGKQKFAPGLATVGGRIHIGYATKEHGFKFLNEPELTHKHTGFVYEH